MTTGPEWRRAANFPAARGGGLIGGRLLPPWRWQEPAGPGPVSADEFLDPSGGSRRLGGGGGGTRAAAQQGGCRRESEQGDRSADPERPVEAAGQRHACRLALAEQGAH